jgi:FtsP/CotA-like multicopper oxidase with cupredoxin domain
MSETSMRFSRSAALSAFLLLAGFAAAQTNPPFANTGSVRVDDPKGSVILLADADRGGLAPPLGTVHLRYYQGWTLSKPDVKVPADPSVFSPGPTMRARVGKQVSILFLNRINDKNFSYTFVTADGTSNPQYGCDEASNPAVYPAKDVFPNCFHGSSTANIHFHGTHTTPDGLGDNVLVQVMPDRSVSVDTWVKYFKEVLAKKSIPTSWAGLPAGYRTKQQALVTAKGGDLWHYDHQQIGLGQWPQYIAGAYFNVFQIPEYKKGGKYKAGQAPGTHWYHAHKHGSTALHSLHGMAGVFIIEGAYDDFFKTFYGKTNTYGPEFEKVLTFQLINPNQNLQRQSVNFGSIGPGVLTLNGASIYTNTAGAAIAPVINMRPGEVQLWRVLNASNGSIFKGQSPPTGAGPGVIFPDLFQTTGFTFKQTAKDGVQFSPGNYKNQPFLNLLVPNQAGAPPGLFLAGGNRADVLVQAPKTVPAVNPVPFTSNQGVVLYVNVTGDPVTMDIPPDDQWPEMPEDFDDLAQPPDYPHQVTFGWDAEPGRPQAAGGRLTSNVGLSLPPRYTIDNRQFEQNGPLVDQCMPLDGLQEWVVQNETTVTHPFHIHINPFQVTKIEVPVPSTDGTSVTYTTYAPKGDFWWSDVQNIPAGVALANGQVAPGKVTIRHRFVDFTGTYVLHCHILAHEDRGMMQLVRVVPTKKYPEDCQQAIPRHH